MSKPKSQKSQTTQTTRELPCILTDDEKREFGRRLADLEHNREQIEADKKAAMDSFKDQLSAVDTGIRRLVTSIRDGMERRDVACTYIYHWSSFTKELVRDDTAEVIEREVIGPDERQYGLDALDANAQ